jgi:thiazole/oxazole-forming peptide maturase SagD family component
MKRINTYFIEMLRKLRIERQSLWMFMPKTMTFVEGCIAMYYEVSNHSKKDEYLISLVIDELVATGILRSDPVTYYSYEVGTQIIHDVLLTTSDNKVFSRGTSIDKSEAYAKALGEVFERTSIRYNTDADTIVCSQNELQKKGYRYVSVDLFPQATPLQKQHFPETIFDRDTQFSWVQVEDLEGTAHILGKKYIPAQTVFLSNLRSYPNEKVMINSTSHGAGAGYTKEQAITSGVYEVINRHFFLSDWYKNSIPHRIDPNSIPKNSIVFSLLSDLEKRGFIVHFLDYSDKAGVPSIVCVISKDGGWSCGGTASPSMEKALERSLMEAFATYTWYMQKTIHGENVYTKQDIVSVQDGFVDTVHSDAVSRIMIYNHAYYLGTKQFSPTMVEGTYTSFSTNHDKGVDFDSVRHARELFGGVYCYFPAKEYLQTYGYISAKIIIPTSYFFNLYEIHSRPILNGTYPQNEEMNPFP